MGEFGEVMALCVGGYGEGSRDVHRLVDIMAKLRVRFEQLRRGNAPREHAIGAEVTVIR